MPCKSPDELFAASPEDSKGVNLPELNVKAVHENCPSVTEIILHTICAEKGNSEFARRKIFFKAPQGY